MNKYFIAIIFFLSTLSYASETLASVEGHYDCNWINNKTGETVKGVMALKKTDQTYSMESNYDDNTSYAGTGLYNKTKTNFTLVFYNPKDSKETGVALVDIHRGMIDPIWTWAYVNATTIEHTTCTKRAR